MAGITARADWTNWHPSAWGSYRGTNETVTVFVGTNGVFYYTPTPTATNGTNVVIANREIVGRDITLAARERAAAVGVTNDPVQVFRSQRDMLIAAKAQVKALLSAGWYLDTTIADTNGNYESFLATNTAHQGDSPAWFRDPPPSLTVAAACFRAGVPSNYLDATPWRALWCGDTGMSRVVTCQFSFVVSGPGAVTNTVPDCCGNTVTISGTNGQVVSVVCTNDWIAEGFNASDYGVCGITNIFKQMVHTKVMANGGEIRESATLDLAMDLYGLACWYSGCAAMKTAWETAWGTQDSITCADTNEPPYQAEYESLQYAALPRKFATISGCSTCSYLSATLPHGATAENLWMSMKPTVGTTNSARALDLYFAKSTNAFYAGEVVGMGGAYWLGGYAVTNDIYDYGYSFSNSLCRWGSYTNTETQPECVTIGDTGLAFPDWPACPTSAETSPSGKGYLLRAAVWVARWNVAGGFNYK